MPGSSVYSVGFLKKILHQYHLLFVWLFGQTVGFFIGTRVVDDIAVLLRFEGSIESSLLLMILSELLPLCFVYLAVIFRKPFLLTLLVFLKAFFFAYCLGCVFVAFANAGWLVRWLLFFSDNIGIFVFLFFVLTKNANDRSQLTCRFIGCVTVLLIIVFIDYNAILPFLITCM